MADRFEKETLEIHQRRRAAYLAIAAAEPERCVVIDASGPPRLRTYGAGETARARLLRLYAEWTRAGRPGVERLRVTALPPGAAPCPHDGQTLLHRPSTTLLLSNA